MKTLMEKLQRKHPHLVRAFGICLLGLLLYLFGTFIHTGWTVWNTARYHQTKIDLLYTGRALSELLKKGEEIQAGTDWEGLSTTFHAGYPSL
jgi:hypothetical protein